jgi:hypothetical protein
MPYVLGLESIGDTLIQARRRIMRRQIKLDINRSSHRQALQLGSRERPWCARIVGVSMDGKLKREFVTGLKSYESANGTGNRGVHYWFILRDGIYEVFRHETWQRSRQYFFRVTGDSATEINHAEVLKCL